MKKNNFIKVICLVLSMVMVIGMLAACKQEPAPEPDVPETPITAEAILSNFLKVEYTAPKAELDKVIDLNKEYGNNYEIYENDSNGSLYIVFRKETKDFLNNLTETYSVYSAEENKIVFTLSNTYPDEFKGLDDFDNQKMPPKTLDVSVKCVDGVDFIIATYTHYTPLDEDYIEDEKLNFSYDITASSVLYDITGEEIASSDSYVTAMSGVNEINSNDKYVIINYGFVNAVVDKETGKVVEKYDGETGNASALYDYYGEKYNYLYHIPEGVTDEDNFNRGKLAIYDKEGNEVLTYKYSDLVYGITVPHVLECGDVMLQKITPTENDDYDVICPLIEHSMMVYGTMAMQMYGKTCYVDTFLLDVSTGKVAPVEFNYLLTSSKTKDELDSTVNGVDVSLTDNVRNVGGAYAFDKNGGEDTATVLFFDNLLNVNFSIDGFKFAPEMKTDEIVKVFSDGSMLVNLDSSVAYQAIIDKDGKLTYLPEGATVVGEYIVIGNEVYDLELNNIRTISNSWLPKFYDSEIEKGAKVEYDNLGFCGMNAVYKVSGWEPVYDEDDDDRIDHFDPFYFVCVVDFNSGNYTKYENTTVKAVTEDYFIFFDEENNEYTIYDADEVALTRFFSRYTPVIYEVGDNFLLTYTDIDGNEIIKLLVREVSANDKGGTK